MDKDCVSRRGLQQATVIRAVVALGCAHDGPSAPDAGSPGVDSGAPPACVVAQCREGVAVLCDRSLTLDCREFGAACADFVDTDGAAFSWCDCGATGDGRGACLGRNEAIVCEQGLARPAECPPGTECIASADQPLGIACVCDGLADGVCGDAACTNDPDGETCTPWCGGRSCGDNGCGGSCGSCPLGESCSEGVSTPSCTPSCAGRDCGSDGCGGSCGTCAGGSSCNAWGLCEGACVPSCAGRVCGSDGCGGSCGSCPEGRECAPDRASCVCDFFSLITYTFDASAVNFTDINYIALNVNHYAEDGRRGTTEGFVLTRDAPAATYRTSGCVPDIEVRRSYSVRGGVSCEHSDRVTRTDIVIPAPIITGSSCTVPPL